MLPLPVRSLITLLDDSALKPKGVSFATAAASTVEPLTALQAIRNKGGLKSGGSILVIGAAGGVGSAAVQLAKNLLGASHVTAVCGQKDVQRVKDEFGADVVIDRSSEPNYLKRLIQQNAKFDVILDTPCVLPSSATKLLKPKGVVVTTAPTGTMMWNMLKLIFSSKSAASVIVNSNRADLHSVGNLLAADKLRVPIDSTYKVKDVKTALLKEHGKKSGRVVIQVENGWN
jgi:NADPH:quinone reductase-like Zn-dependent oxidoreductase